MQARPHALAISRLPSPDELRTRLPRGSGAAAVVKDARRSIADILHGHDPVRLVVIVGPCSLHDSEAALLYAERLRAVARDTSECLVIAMRTYLEKPRTARGWKGLLKDPHMDESCDLAQGLELGRQLRCSINELGLPCASELLDPMTPSYIADLLSWAAIGARTSESQTHRELASGLSLPVGFKNGTSGSLEIARNAIVAAREPQTVFGLDSTGRASLVRTRGNPDAHLVLRGGRDRANHSRDDVARANALISDLRLSRPLLIDCSHDNSRADHRRQAEVCRSVLGQIRGGRHGIMGVMLESHLRAGRQAWQSGQTPEFGISVTDACIGWDETEALLYEIAEAVAVSKDLAPPGKLGPTELAKETT